MDKIFYCFGISHIGLWLMISYVLSEPRKVLPILKTDEPVCPEGKLSCGNGECIEKELFCNDKPDCKDESDENACSKYSFFFH